MSNTLLKNKTYASESHSSDGTRTKRIQSFHAAAVLSLMLALPTAEAAFISAQSQVCKGYYGYVDKPVRACGKGNAGGGGGAVIGGSGVGSGINIPFQQDSYNSEFSASAAALQDYGVFHGYALINVTDRNPNIMSSSYSATADGQYQDTLTIGGGTGKGKLKLGFTVSGNAMANAFASGGNGSESAVAELRITVWLNSVFGGGLVARNGGTYALTLDGPDALDFTFGVPFKLDVLHGVSAGGGYDGNNPPMFFQLDASSSFEHTASLTGITATDLFGNPISNITLTAESGTHYPLSSPVPLPAAVWLFGSGLLGLMGVGRRKHAVMTGK